MEFDALRYRYPSRRSVVFGTKGMVCSSQPLAAQAGLGMLKQGGTAADAIIAAASCLTVLEPTSNGLGSDAFALYWNEKEKKLYGLNGSGYAPAHLTPETMMQNGADKMPVRGWGAVDVPGAVSAWAELHKKFGALDFSNVLQPAISYAEDGFPVQPIVSLLWQQGVKTFAPYEKEAEFAPFFQTFFQNGAPKPGQRVQLPDHGQTLRDIAATKGESFYRGRLAEKILAFSKESGGYFGKDDLKNYRAQWVEPIATDYHGYTVCEIPPNGQGLVVLMTLNILKHLELSQKHHDNPETVHLQLEAMKQAFADGMEYIADPRTMKVKTEQLLSETYAAKRAAEITDTALVPKPGDPNCGGTVYLCAADQYGNMVSYIQSNYKGFGSGIVIPGTGIALNNRACDFSLHPESGNYLQPGKKPYHTIIPGFLMKDGEAAGPFGVMGAYMQPQGQVQVLMNLLDFGMNPQEALDAPRWQWTGGKNIELEAGFGKTMADALVKKGHAVQMMEDFTSFGRGQIILKDENGVYAAASEPRADGCAAAW